MRGPWLARRAHVRDLRLAGRGHVGARGSWVQNHSLSARRPTPTGPWRSTSVGCPSWWLHGSGSVRGPYGGGSMRAAPRRRPRRRPRTDCPRRSTCVGVRAGGCTTVTPRAGSLVGGPLQRLYTARHRRPHVGARIGGLTLAAVRQPPRTGARTSGPTSAPIPAAPRRPPRTGARTSGPTSAALYRRLRANRPRQPPRAGRPAPAARPHTRRSTSAPPSGGPRRSRSGRRTPPQPSRRSHHQAGRGGVRTP